MKAWIRPPGSVWLKDAPEGNAAKFIAAGSDIIFESHYTTDGKPEVDQSMVGIVLAKQPPLQRHITTTAISERRFEIPAGDGNYEVDGVGYELATPLDLPKGTKIKTVSHYDNSTANKYNPNPKINVRYGAQSWDEMNVSFVGIVVDQKADPSKVFRRAGRTFEVE